MDALSFLVPFFSVGLIFIVVSVPMILGKVPPNPQYGFRTKKTLSDPQIWYAANRFCGWALALAGLVTVIAGIVLVKLYPDAGETFFIVSFSAVLVVVTAVALIASFRHLRTL